LYPRQANTELPGVFMEQQLLAHAHETTTGHLPVPPFGSTGVPQNKKVIGAYDRIITEFTDLTSLPVSPTNGAALSNIGTENRPNSVVERRYVLC